MVTFSVSCEAGTYRITADTECKPCPKNEYSETEGASVCTKCDAGQVSKEGSSTCSKFY